MHDPLSPVFGESRAGHPLAERPEFPAYVFLKWLVYRRRAESGPDPETDAARITPAWLTGQATRLQLRSTLAWPVTNRLKNGHASRQLLDTLADDDILVRESHHAAELPKYRWREPITRGTWSSFQNLSKAARGRFDIAFAVHQVIERFGDDAIHRDRLREAYVGRNGQAKGLRRWFRRKNRDTPPHWEHDVIGTLTASGALEDTPPRPTDLGLRINHWYELFAYSVGYQPEPDAAAPDAPIAPTGSPTERNTLPSSQKSDRKH